MKAPYLVPLLAAGFVLAGCAEPTTAPEQVDTGLDSQPAFDFSNGPEMPGQSHLLRFAADEEWLLSTQSNDDQLFTVYGDPSETFFCGGAGNPEFSVQWNDIDDAVSSIAMKKDFTIYVYEFFSQPPADFCDYLATNWAYRGTVSLTETYHDSRVNGTQTWRWTVNGIVYDQDGNPYTFHELQHFARDATFNGAWLSEDIKVTPRGGN
jgi:hypothetical protein